MSRLSRPPLANARSADRAEARLRPKARPRQTAGRRVVAVRAISDPPPAPGSEREEDETTAQLPSLRDYDEAEYPGADATSR